MPSVNFTPWISFGNWLWPSSRRQLFWAPSTSLNTIASAVLFERQPFERIVRCRTVAKVLSIGFVMHLKEIGDNVAPGAHAALVLDGAGYHLATGLAVPGNIILVHQPPYAPELNPIENVWQYLRGNKLSNTIYENYDDILEKACQAWMFFANDKEQVASITTRQWAKVNL